jgi:hypothetical protein
MSVNWAPLITNQFRSTGSKGWATPYPDATAYRLGDYGPVVNGAFSRIGNINSSMTTTKPSVAGNYTYQDQYVSITNSGGKISGDFFDPEEGVEVHAGIEWQWTLEKSDTLFITMPAVYFTSFQNVLDPVQDPGTAALLWEMAYANKWMNDDGTIKTGFSVVVGLEQIVSGFVGCSVSDNSQLTIQGTASGVSELLSGSASASYSSCVMDNGGFVMVWPAAPAANSNDQSAASESNMRTIALVLLSFDSYMPSRGTGSLVYPYLG